MKLSHFFIDHPRFAAVINIFIVVFGLAAMAFLPVAQYPNIVPPTIQITTVYPGASAEVVARTVATPLEQAINGVENMDYISSQSTGNGAAHDHGDLQDRHRPEHRPHAHAEPRSGHAVPAAAGSAGSGRAGQEDHPGLASRCTRLFAGWLSQPRIHVQLHAQDPRRDRAPARCRGLPLFGERDYAMRIWIDPDKAAADGISASDILSALRAQNAQVSAGVLNAPPVTTNGGLPDQRPGARPTHDARTIRQHHRQVGQPGARHPHP